MRLPKHSNPHLIADTTRIVSRKTLHLQDDVDDDTERGGETDGVGLDGQEVEDLYGKLDMIVSKRLKFKRAFAPSDEPSSSKRSKILVEGEGKPIEPPEPVGVCTSSCSPQTSH
jgi:hypothetical protein